MKTAPRTPARTLLCPFSHHVAPVLSLHVHNLRRTGRVRPGTVYKLYSRAMGTEIMSEHGMSEILRLPLDALILDLKNMMPGSPVIPILKVGA